jgi:outer membrane protein assembly factor BamB
MSNLLVSAFSGHVFGVDPGSGEVRWEHELDMAGNATAVVLTRDAVFAATFSMLSMIRYPSGELVWSVPTSASGRATLLLDDDRLFVAKRGEIEAFALDGKTLWRNRFKGKGLGSVVLGVPGNVAQADDAG